MSRRLQFSLKALLVLVLAAACFFGGIRVERERQRREDEAAALAASNAERQAALTRIGQRRMALAASQLDLQRQQIAAEEARERINREFFLQEQKVDQLMARFNALIAEFPDSDPLVSPDPATGAKLRQRRAAIPAGRASWSWRSLKGLSGSAKAADNRYPLVRLLPKKKPP